eukprot:SM000013S26436  [mRNA]  locus=s13:443280:445142:+ [translate_table: standard]
MMTRMQVPLGRRISSKRWNDAAEDGGGGKDGASSGGAGAETAAAMEVTLDCDEVVFDHVLRLLRYRSLQKLPALTKEEVFCLTKELDFLGIDVDGPTFAAATGVTVQELSVDALQLPSDLADPTMLVSIRDDDAEYCNKADNNGVKVSLHHCYAFCSCPENCLSEPRKAPLLTKIVLEALADFDEQHHEHCEWASEILNSVAGDGYSVWQDCPSLLVTVPVPGLYCPSCLSPSANWALNLSWRHAFCSNCKARLLEDKALPRLTLAAVARARACISEQMAK